MSKVKINKVEIAIGEVSVQLTLEEAKELKRILNDAFPEKSIPLPYIPSVVIDRRPHYPPYNPWAITCTSDSAGGTLGIKNV